jgi:hypothetical protein
VLSVVAVVVAGVGVLVAVRGQRHWARVAAGRGLLLASMGAVVPPPREGEPGQPDHLALDPRVLDPSALRDVAVVRYDALQQLSGQLSFSVALLNSHGDGIVLTSINGRAEARTYAKGIVAGKGAQELSPEEEEAIRVARLGEGPDVARVASKPKITSQTGGAVSPTR